MTDPCVVILAGPNGAGKSTLAPTLLRGHLGVKQFVNADVIASGLSGFAPETTALAAGRIMVQRLHELSRHRESFAFETTLASHTNTPSLHGSRNSARVDIVSTSSSSGSLPPRWPLPESDQGWRAVDTTWLNLLSGGDTSLACGTSFTSTARLLTRGGCTILLEIPSKWRSDLAQPFLASNAMRPGALFEKWLTVNPEDIKDIDAIFKDGRLIDEALHEAFREAVRYHVRLNRPLVIWRDGVVQQVPADDFLN